VLSISAFSARFRRDPSGLPCPCGAPDRASARPRLFENRRAWPSPAPAGGGQFLRPSRVRAHVEVLLDPQLLAPPAKRCRPRPPGVRCASNPLHLRASPGAPPDCGLSWRVGWGPPNFDRVGPVVAPPRRVVPRPPAGASVRVVLHRAEVNKHHVADGDSCSPNFELPRARSSQAAVERGVPLAGLFRSFEEEAPVLQRTPRQWLREGARRLFQFTNELSFVLRWCGPARIGFCSPFEVRGLAPGALWDDGQGECHGRR